MAGGRQPEGLECQEDGWRASAFHTRSSSCSIFLCPSHLQRCHRTHVMVQTRCWCCRWCCCTCDRHLLRSCCRYLPRRRRRLRLQKRVRVQGCFSRVDHLLVLELWHLGGAGIHWTERHGAFGHASALELTLRLWTANGILAFPITSRLCAVAVALLAALCCAKRWAADRSASATLAILAVRVRTNYSTARLTASSLALLHALSAQRHAARRRADGLAHLIARR